MYLIIIHTLFTLKYHHIFSPSSINDVMLEGIKIAVTLSKFLGPVCAALCPVSAAAMQSQAGGGRDPRPFTTLT